MWRKRQTGRQRRAALKGVMTRLGMPMRLNRRTMRMEPVKKSEEDEGWQQI